LVGACGAIVVGASAAPAFADVLGYYYAPPAALYAPTPVYTYTYTYTEPTYTPAPTAQAAETTTTTTTTYNAPVVAPTPPPPPRVEVIPPAPAAPMLWQAGYWSYNGTAWDWIPGHYEARPQPTAQWIPGHWTQQSDGGAWVWVRGRWTT